MVSLDYLKKTEEITTWIKKTVQAAGFQKVVVAVSGGIDSAVSLSLTVKALGAENVYAILLPYGELSETSLMHGQLVTKSAGLPQENVFTRDIKSGVDAIVKHCEGSIDSIRKGNIMARMRMMYLFDLAKQQNALVIGTENKSEYLLGYFTRFGDEASDLEPIRSFYKTQVWKLAKFLKVPKEIIEKAPSANLWEGQSDEKEFEFSYIQADTVLYHYCEKKLTKEEIIALGNEREVVEKVLAYVTKNEFKHHVPYVLE